MSPRDVLQRLIESVDASDLETYASLFADDAVSHHPLEAEPLRGRAAIAAAEAALHAAFSDVEVKATQTFVAGSTAAAEVVLTATNTGALDIGDGQTVPATGRRIEVPAVWIVDVDDGLIRESRDYFDSAVLFRQLGLQD